jgi:hypothetical protein
MTGAGAVLLGASAVVFAAAFIADGGGRGLAIENNVALLHVAYFGRSSSFSIYSSSHKNPPKGDGRGLRYSLVEAFGIGSTNIGPGRDLAQSGRRTLGIEFR